MSATLNADELNCEMSPDAVNEKSTAAMEDSPSMGPGDGSGDG